MLKIPDKLKGACTPDYLVICVQSFIASYNFL